MRRLLAKGFGKLGGAFRRAAVLIWTDPLHKVRSERNRPFFAADGDNTLRLDYELSSESVVFDLGGYKGQWASDIFSRYCCPMHVFEPVEPFYHRIRARFRDNPHITVHNFGLAEKTKSVPYGLNADGTSMFNSSGVDGAMQLVCADEFLSENQITRIDLMKINIEGGEYDLLERLLESGYVRNIVNIQVQFHDFVPDAEARMKSIQERLRATHSLTYQYPFVWENWRLRRAVDDRGPR